MKKITTTLLVILGITSGFCQENDSNEFTGEDFSLEGALAVFKKSNSLEEFEKLINQEDNNVNNLDLNNDGETDYITVEDIKDNDTHVIVLSTYLGDNDKQDIATIGIEKTGKEEAMLEITGDSELYAENTIVEPFDIAESMDKSKSGPAQPEISSTRIIVNVWFWPSVRFIYAPGYVIWVSPHHWHYYPRWWRPWKIYHHRIFYKRCAPHRVYYHRTPTHRVVVARKVYTPKRHSSALIVKSPRKTTVIHRDRNDRNDRNVRVKSPRKTSVIQKDRSNRVKTVKVRSGGRR
ncbi:hypothetical protein [Flavobacterium sp.]|uniref:hypothetical protein n=1 Tax=Flavobacterium sp. TaxID=239 RepID=UPI0026133378|nr:hypothetical protein [Flavobacterium sp.]